MKNYNHKGEQKLEMGKEVAFCAFGKIWIGKVGVINNDRECFQVSNFRPHPLNKDETWTNVRKIVDLEFYDYKRSACSWYLENDLRHRWCFPDSTKYLNHLLNKIDEINRMRKRTQSNNEKAVQRSKEINHLLDIIQKVHDNYNEVWIMLKGGEPRCLSVDVVHHYNHFYIRTTKLDGVSPVWIRLEKFEQSFFLSKDDCLARHRSIIREKKKRKILFSNEDCFFYQGDCGGNAIIYPKVKKVYFEHPDGFVETGWQGICKDNIYKCFKNAINDRASKNEICLQLIDEMAEEHLIEGLEVQKCLM